MFIKKRYGLSILLIITIIIIAFYSIKSVEEVSAAIVVTPTRNDIQDQQIEQIIEKLREHEERISIIEEQPKKKRIRRRKDK